MRLYTIGYEGIYAEQMFAILAQGQVQVLVDVREYPVSRKRGFSKSSLAETSERLGLKYVHLPMLGSPRTVRHTYRADGNWQQFAEQFESYLATQDEAMLELAGLICQQVCCLLCYEADPCSCHRSLVVTRLLKMTPAAVAVHHLKKADQVPVAQSQSQQFWVDIPVQ